ncbi:MULTISPECIES: pyridoxamine kinase [unclassified Granulicatella]|uniref:pyridoxamine kinase n=1 Tax=unclassified Granulicatella TaxID=2630493 RepID=UPI001073BB4B|nr:MULTISPECIES: pyridoxamine kinase [unclassified Granulicatella]MBF0779843.1 pyridoxamine kinase [Granulicatella sp. 19428wC4_WM01]TFU96143.1 pyridoxamine kinase [Granulicatella sp. WM01]
MRLPSLLLINDLSGFGKVAISASLPLLSSCQIETSLLPSVLLSTHTAFPNPYRCTLQHDMSAILKHWETLNLSFDAILTGYFNDDAQIDYLLSHLPKHQLLIVDPVMADNGHLYRGFSNEYPMHMARLCQKADIIMPNLTEACLLANRNYLSTYTYEDIQHLLETLHTQLHVDTIIITGISFDKQSIGAMFLHQGECHYCSSSYIPHHFFGSGDMFSALIAAFTLHHIPLPQGVQMALDFIVACLHDTCASNREITHGIIFEKQLHQLHHLIKGNYYDTK